MNRDKLMLGLIILCLSFDLNAQINSDNHGIHWHNELSWTEVKALAKKMGKNIFLDCYATWCGPCKMMDKDVYSNDSVAVYFNKNFISIRLQMDTTLHDDETAKKWFAFADEVKNKYGVDGFPTLLFLSPNDTLLDKRLGYQSVNNLLVSSQTVSSNIRLYNQLDEYRKGVKNYLVMQELADFVQTIMGDRELSNQIANDYKEGYLEKLSTDSLLTKKSLTFVVSYPETIRSQDHLFRVYYQYSQKVDSLMGKQMAVRFVNWLVTKEELLIRLVKDKKPINKLDPDWHSLEKTIHAKYPMLDASALVRNFCITYYRRYDLNWSKWAYNKNVRIKQMPPNYKDWFAISSELNDKGAWDVFKNCNEKSILQIALKWINLAIELENKRQPGNPNSAYLDTKANILYKLGKVKDAIKIERDAVEAALKKETKAGNNEAKGFKQVIEQMKAGEPTYLKQNAVWDARTFPIKSSSMRSNNSYSK